MAVVFDTVYKPAQGDIGDLPSTFTINGKAYKVIDGDVHDMRLSMFDGVSVIIGLRGKGGKRNVTAGVRSGFIQATVGGVSQESRRTWQTIREKAA